MSMFAFLQRELCFFFEILLETNIPINKNMGLDFIKVERSAFFRYFLLIFCWLATKGRSTVR